MLMVQLACPKCGFVIEEYRADQLEADAQKQKRYQYLKKKQALCPSCLTQTTKLEERRVDVEARPETAAPEVAKAEAPVEVPRAAEAHGPTPLCDELERGPWPSHVTELKKTRYHLQMYEESLSRRQTQWGFGGYVSLPGLQPAPRSPRGPTSSACSRPPATSTPPRCSVRYATSPTATPTGSSISTAREGTSRSWGSPRSSCWKW